MTDEEAATWDALLEHAASQAEEHPVPSASILELLVDRSSKLVEGAECVALLISCQVRTTLTIHTVLSELVRCYFV